MPSSASARCWVFWSCRLSTRSRCRPMVVDRAGQWRRTWPSASFMSWSSVSAYSSSAMRSRSPVVHRPGNAARAGPRGTRRLPNRETRTNHTAVVRVKHRPPRRRGNGVNHHRLPLRGRSVCGFGGCRPVVGKWTGLVNPPGDASNHAWLLVGSSMILTRFAPLQSLRVGDIDGFQRDNDRVYGAATDPGSRDGPCGRISSVTRGRAAQEACLP